MILQTSILSKNDEHLIRERISAYFLKLGYTLKRSDSALVFQRGSPTGSWLAFSPMYWKVETLVEFKRDSPTTKEVSVVFIISTAGQLITRIERKFWAAELKGAEAAITTGELQYGESIQLANDAINQNLLSYLILGIISIVFGFVGLFVIASLAATFLLLVLGLVLWWLALRYFQKRN